MSFYSDRLILKYHIRQLKNINSIDFSMFTLSIASLVAENSKNISGRYNLNSEGDLVLFLANGGQLILDFIKEHLVPILLEYFILIGGKVAGIEFPSSIDKVKNLVANFLFRKETRRLKMAEVVKAEAEAAQA